MSAAGNRTRDLLIKRQAELALLGAHFIFKFFNTFLIPSPLFFVNVVKAKETAPTRPLRSQLKRRLRSDYFLFHH